MTADGHPVAESWVEVDNEFERYYTYGDGYFYRLVTAGQHTVTASALGTQSPVSAADCSVCYLTLCRCCTGYEDMSKSVTVKSESTSDLLYKLKVNVNFMPYHDSTQMKQLLENITQANSNLATIYR